MTRASRFEWEREIRRSPDVVGGAQHVLLLLGTYMNQDGSNARPGHLRLAEDAGLGESTIRRHLAWAVKNGWLIKVGHGGRRGDLTPIAVTYLAATPPLAGERTTTESTAHQRADNYEVHRSLDASPPLTEAESTAHQRAPTGLNHARPLRSRPADCPRCAGTGFDGDDDQGRPIKCDHLPIQATA